MHRTPHKSPCLELFSFSDKGNVDAGLPPVLDSKEVSWFCCQQFWSTTHYIILAHNCIVKSKVGILYEVELPVKRANITVL